MWYGQHHHDTVMKSRNILSIEVIAAFCVANAPVYVHRASMFSSPVISISPFHVAKYVSALPVKEPTTTAWNFAPSRHYA